MHINPNERIEGMTAKRKETPPISEEIVINERSKIATIIILRYGLELLRISLLNKPTDKINMDGNGKTSYGMIISEITIEQQTMIADRGVGLLITLLLFFQRLRQSHYQ